MFPTPTSNPEQPTPPPLDTELPFVAPREVPPEIAELMQHESVLDFIETRNIKPEDLRIIEDALRIPRQYYLENHNTPSSKAENLGKYLELEQKNLHAKLVDANINPEMQERIKYALAYADVMSEVCQKYDWTAAWNLNSVMERVAPKKLSKTMPIQSASSI